MPVKLLGWVGNSLKLLALVVFFDNPTTNGLVRIGDQFESSELSQPKFFLISEVKRSNFLAVILGRLERRLKNGGSSLTTSPAPFPKKKWERR